MRFCACGNVYGQYLNNSEAEVSKNAVSIAIGNGSLDASIFQMQSMLKAMESDKQPDRNWWIHHGKIHYVWVRPNEGEGNPHTRVTDKDIRPVIFVETSLIDITNTKLKEEVVAEIVKEGWIQEKGLAFPSLRQKNGRFIITDGNHRLEALKRMGEKFAPLVSLSSEEFEKVKFKKNTGVEFNIHFPELPLFYTA